jgi:hypothetical protein
MLMLVLACNRDKSQENPVVSNTTGTNSSLVTQVNDAFLAVNITGGTETEPFSLINDGLPDEYQFEENALAGNGPATGTKDSIGAGGNGDPALRMRACLSKLNLTDDQKAAIKEANMTYSKCKGSTIARYMKMVNEIKIRFNNQRMALLAKMKSHEITKDQFARQMKELQGQFASAVRDLKQTEAGILKGCFEQFMSTIKSTLTDEQWAAFIACYGKV